jgi:hypothetical protein
MKDKNPFYNSNAGTNTNEITKKDSFGNTKGNKYDLAKNDAFKGQNIAVLHLYTDEGFDFALPSKALKEKGFEILRWSKLPSIESFKKGLENASQLWVISSNTKYLNDEYINVIEDFFNKGHGLFIWGDNDPYFVDANFISNKLFNLSMSGNVMGDKIVTINNGLKKGHLLTTGLEFLYEGITIATIDNSNKILTPIMYGSAKNLVTAVYEKQNKRAIIDGGFTRLYCNWDTAGTARFVKNAAAWLANTERFYKNTELAKQKVNLDDFDFGNKKEAKKSLPTKTIKPNIDNFEF